MRTLINHIRVSYAGITGSLFLVVWLLFSYLTGYNIGIRYYVYSLLIPFVLPLMKKWTKDSDRLMRWLSIAMAIFFAACCTLGYSIYRTCSLDLCFGSKALFALTFFKMAVYSYIFYKIILCAFSNVIWYNDNNLCVFVICRIPYLMAFYPCIFDPDAATSLSNFGEGRILNNNHPFLVTCLQKMFFELGKFLGDPSIGLALMSLLFILLVSALLVYVIRLCGRIGAGLGLQKWLVLLFALLPFFSLLNIYDTKDGIFAYSSLLFVATLADILWHSKKGEKPEIKLLLMHGMAVILLCFSRHQGIYFVLVQYLLLVIFFTQWKKGMNMEQYGRIRGIRKIKIILPYQLLSRGS